MGDVDHAGIEVGGDAVGAMRADGIHRGIDGEATGRHHRAEAPEQSGHVTHLRQAVVDHPHQLAPARGSFDELQHRHRSRAVGDGQNRSFGHQAITDSTHCWASSTARSRLLGEGR